MGHSPVEAQVLRLRGESSRLERGFQRPVLAEDRGRCLGADAARAGELVGGIAAQRDEVRHLRGLDAVALANLGRPDPRELGDALHRLEHGRQLADELERVAVGGGDERRPASLLLLGDRGGEEVVRLVPGLLRGREAHRTDELREQLELLEQLGIEDAARLVGGERLAAIGGLADAVPADEHGARLLRLPQAEQEVGEADDRAGREAGRAPHRLGQGVVGAVGQRVAVDDEQWPTCTHSDS